MSLPYAVGEALTCQQIRELDVLAIEHVGIPGIVLMENAGRAAAEFIFGMLVDPERDAVAVLCGSGNNGGDGFVIARHLYNAGVRVHVLLANPPEKSQGDARTNLAILERMGLEFVHAYQAEAAGPLRRTLSDAAVIVDALLGTGSSGAPRGTLATLIELANTTPGARRIAIDIPTGFDAERGQVHEPCFRAAATVTMVAPKLGFESAAGRGVVGRVIVVDIGVPRELIPGRRESRAQAQ